MLHSVSYLVMDQLALITEAYQWLDVVRIQEDSWIVYVK